MHRHLKAIVAALTAAGLSAGIGVSASAADLPPAPGYAKAPIAPAYNWTGCYVGVHAGGGIIGTSFINGTGSTDGGGGALAGGQAGCNYQAGQFVFGLEGEGAWSGITDRFHEISTDGFTETQTGRNRWDADLALRVGFAVDRALVYGKAGAAFGSFEFTDDESFFSSSSHGQSTTLNGLLLGAGVEYAFASNWTAKLEYNVIDFVAKDISFTSSDGPFTESQSAKKQIVKVGVNYRFGN
jgi:outer membrane immunogenic protein